MGIADVRDAFTDAGDGLLVCQQARLRYDHEAGPNMQVLEFDGHHVNGAQFKIVSAPFDGSPLDMARQSARELIAKYAAEHVKPTMMPTEGA